MSKQPGQTDSEHQQHRDFDNKLYYNLFEQTLIQLVENGLDDQICIEILYENGVFNSKIWQFKFKGNQKSVYAGKTITGILDQNIKGSLHFTDIKITPPKCYFDKIQSYNGYNGYPMHENIFGNGLFHIPTLSQDCPLCIMYQQYPMIIMQQIVYFFHNPSEFHHINQNFPKDDAARQKIRRELADALGNEEL
ncbi:hypothetical protein pb186bvf_002436 [Paramecium bursaria]